MLRTRAHEFTVCRARLGAGMGAHLSAKKTRERSCTKICCQKHMIHKRKYVVVVLRFPLLGVRCAHPRYHLERVPYSNCGFIRRSCRSARPACCWTGIHPSMCASMREPCYIKKKSSQQSFMCACLRAVQGERCAPCASIKKKRTARE